MKEQKRRVVVKVGTSTLTHSSGSLDLRSMERLVRVLADLSGGGHEVILVTSGAIAVGSLLVASIVRMTPWYHAPRAQSLPTPQKEVRP